MRDCTHLIVVLSPASVASAWVAYEVGRAAEQGLTVLPYLTHPSIHSPGFFGDALGISGLDSLKKHVVALSSNVPALVEELVKKLNRIPSAIQSLRIAEAPRRALGNSAVVVLREYLENLEELERGRLVVRGPEMDNIFGSFVDAVTSGFKALSRDDLDYWASPESEQYLGHNKTLLDRGYVVERIFVLPRSKPITKEQREALRQQVQMKIRVRIAYLDSCKQFVDDDRELDFGLFDNFVVSFWRFSTGRVFKLSTSGPDYHRHRSIYDRVANVCQDVPGKSGPDRTIFDRREQLDECGVPQQNPGQHIRVEGDH